MKAFKMKEQAFQSGVNAGVCFTQGQFCMLSNCQTLFYCDKLNEFDCFLLFFYFF